MKEVKFFPICPFTGFRCSSVSVVNTEQSHSNVKERYYCTEPKESLLLKIEEYLFGTNEFGNVYCEGGQKMIFIKPKGEFECPKGYPRVRTDNNGFTSDSKKL